jgi:hypothetical protein
MDILQPTAEELLVAQVILNCETEWSIMWEMMLSLSDATGHRTALTAFRNCIYLLPLGFLAHQSSCQRNHFGSIPISSSKQFCVGSFLDGKLAFYFYQDFCKRPWLCLPNVVSLVTCAVDINSGYHLQNCINNRYTFPFPKYELI